MNVDELNTAWANLQFDARRSVRYHQRRRAFFEGLDTAVNVLSVLFGSTAIYGVLALHSTWLVLVAAALVTVFATFNLVVGSTRRAWLHADLARRFIDLERQLLTAPSAALLHQLTDARLSIEAEEPPILRVLDSLCYNEQCRAQGYVQRVPIGRWQRWFAQVCDIHADRLKVA